jgi:hypothetical protein
LGGSDWRGSDWRGSDWRGEGRGWVAEARAASRERRRRAWPVRVTTVLSLIAALLIIGIVDAVSRVPMSTYFWTAAAIVGAGLLVGLVTRRTPWSLLPLAVFAVVGGLALSPTSASFWDGLGQRSWQPSTLHSPYRLAVGQAVLDLSNLSPREAGKTVDVTLGVGQVQVLVPKTMPVIVNAHVHIGAVTANQGRVLASGVGVDRTVTSTGVGSPVKVDVHVTDGNVDVRQG